MNKSSKHDVKIINMFRQTKKQIKPLKIILDSDSEVRATNFHGTSKGGRTYMTPQLVLIRATGKEKSVDISFPIEQLKTIIEALTTIQNENDEYFDE